MYSEERARVNRGLTLNRSGYRGLGWVLTGFNSWLGKSTRLLRGQ
jgi:hypothetical protein